MDRLAAASRWQRTQLNALGTTRSTFLSSGFLIQNPSREDPNVETLHLFSTEQYSFCKTDRVLQSLLIFCISTALVVVAWAEPHRHQTTSPREFPGNRSNRARSQRLATANAVTFSKSNSLTAQFTAISTFRFRCIAT